MKNRWMAMVQSAVLAVGLALLLDLISVLCGRALSVVKFGSLLLALWLALWLVPAVTPKLRKWGLTVMGLAVAVLAAAVLCWHGVSQNVAYNAPDQGKAQLYGGKTVMLLVPHQDDDINVLGGVIEEYRKYDSEVYIVYSTNGDYHGQAEIRFTEALDAAEKMGVPGDHVIFLGYGDQWAADGPHIYNAEPGQVMTSHLGRTETYGTAAQGVYQEGNPYTIENFLGDIEAVVLEHRPDVLYCVDMDHIIDHRALSLAFEKVMGRILKEHPDYRPLVYKGYAYDTAWEAVADFHAENLLATQNAFAAPYEEKAEVYRWEERVRLPVHGEGLSRSLFSAGAQEVLASYASQGAQLYGIRIFNSDKVFWHRRTDSLCHEAEIEGPELLADFMLLEDRNLLDDLLDFRDGAWIPAEETESVKITFDQPRAVDTVVLYDIPDKAANVLDARITFDDGTAVETGPLDPGGAASRFRVEKKNVSSFTVTLTSMEGEGGLTEIEAFEGEATELPYIKLMDESGNFAYDYWIDPSGEQRFFLYESGTEAEEYLLEWDNEACSAAWDGDTLRIRCPVGEGTVVTVRTLDGSLSDSIYIQNPGRLERTYAMFWLRAEGKIMELRETKMLSQRLFLCRLWEKVSILLQS